MRNLKMKKSLVGMSLLAVLMLAGCGTSSTGAPSEKVSEKSEEPAKNEASADEQYQKILDEYTIKIKEKAPLLVEEYNAEAPNNQGGLEGLATLSNDKIAELAKISNDGITEMAKVQLKAGSGKYEEYEDWSGKLMDVYTKEADAISKAYTDSAQ